jgi:hypothetical protein
MKRESRRSAGPRHSTPKTLAAAAGAFGSQEAALAAIVRDVVRIAEARRGGAIRKATK